MSSEDEGEEISDSNLESCSDDEEGSDDDVKVEATSATEDEVKDNARSIAASLKAIMSKLKEFDYSAKTLGKMNLNLEAALDLVNDAKRICSK